MAVINEVLFVDGELVTPAELSAISKAVSLWIAGDLLMQEHAAGEWATDTATQHPVGDGTNATDLGGANLRSYGFIGQGLRVTYGNTTTVAVLAGWGLQYASTGVPSAHFVGLCPRSCAAPSSHFAHVSDQTFTRRVPGSHGRLAFSCRVPHAARVSFAPRGTHLKTAGEGAGAEDFFTRGG